MHYPDWNEAWGDEPDNKPDSLPDRGSIRAYQPLTECDTEPKFEELAGEYGVVIAKKRPSNMSSGDLSHHNQYSVWMMTEDGELRGYHFLPCRHTNYRTESVRYGFRAVQFYSGNEE